jgi:penicillin-binding protein 1B
LDLDPPEDVSLVWIDRGTGLRSSEACPSAKQYPFIKGSAPSGFSACSQAGESPPDGPAEGGEKQGEKDESWLKGLF